MLVSEAHGHKVVSTGDASTAGIVDGFVLDPAAGSIAAVGLRKTAGDGSLGLPAVPSYPRATAVDQPNALK